MLQPFMLKFLLDMIHHNLIHIKIIWEKNYSTEASEIAQAKLKGLDESVPKHATVPPRPKPNINSLQNNQVKVAGGATTIPPDQMKCNIFKAKIEEELKKGWSQA